MTSFPFWNDNMLAYMTQKKPGTGAGGLQVSSHVVCRTGE